MQAGEREKAASPLEAVKAVLAAFFGIRRRAAHEAVPLNPVHVIVVGIIAAAMFVAGLILLVKFIMTLAG